MLQADPYALRYTASRFSAGANEFRFQASRLVGSKIELVSNGWKGTASQSFDAQVEHQVTHLRKNAEVLENATTVLNSLANKMEHVMELRRQAEQCEMASWEYSGDSQDDLHHRQNLARQAAYYRQQAEMEANQADSMAVGQFQQIMSMIPNVLSHVHGVGRSGDLDDLPEPKRSYYKRHPELLEDDSTAEVASTSSWASVKEADERFIQQDAEVKVSLLGLLKQLTQKERMGYWDETTVQQVFEQDYGDMSIDELKAQVFARLLKNQAQTDLDEIAVMNDTISTGADFIPVLGNLKSLVEAVTGKDYITSHDLSWFDRGFALAGVFVGGFGKVAGKVAKHAATSQAIEKVAERTGVFAGTLKGEKVILKDVKTQKIVYNKRAPEDTAQLRKDFNSVRKKFLKDLANDPGKVEQLREAGLAEADIAFMRNGNVPIGWQVHHKLPLDDGGTNLFDNLVLINNDPYHKVITNAQMEATRGLKPGESKTMDWPIPEGFVYPKKTE
ncbi:pre-toxin TG domain-containing protein [Tumebacillus permanentifrigoris]|uniref:WXG100 family type VII secretion target n=1 Tax=Tumebacillus permanentifrigoris TaxID=378543 RepID=A0A316D9C0_9BACL|nr:pre-toxin TG domain-containing protein [Tumebacillus permanentifrigoris]PWK12828.1 WXG100 family type VII secretion target [Tumebacillus permanentifrigoris]